MSSPETLLPTKQFVVAVLMAVLVIYWMASSESAALASQIICRGKRDNIDLAHTTLRIPAERRSVFLQSVDRFAESNGMMVGSVVHEPDGRVTLILTSYSGNGVIVRFADREMLNYFIVGVRTCNATSNWRSTWELVVDFVKKQ